MSIEKEGTSDSQFKAVDVDDLARADRLGRFPQLDGNRLEVLDVVVRHGNDDKAQRKLGKVLLAL